MRAVQIMTKAQDRQKYVRRVNHKIIFRLAIYSESLQHSNKIACVQDQVVSSVFPSTYAHNLDIANILNANLVSASARFRSN